VEGVYGANVARSTLSQFLADRQMSVTMAPLPVAAARSSSSGWGSITVLRAGCQRRFSRFFCRYLAPPPPPTPEAN